MKKISKILSLILTVSLIISCLAVNVLADGPTVHNMTINVSKTAALAAGDEVTVEVVMDDTLNLVSVEYVLTYDTNIFTADTTKVPPIPAGVENCVDNTWLSGIKDTSKNWGMFLGTPTYNVANIGEMKFQWAGSYSVMAGYNDTNMVIGKFKLKVKDGVANGTTGQISLTGVTSDNGQVTADMVCAPVTVTYGTVVNEKPAADTTTATLASNPNAALDNKYTQGFLATATATEDTKPITGIKFEFENGLGATAERSYALNAISGVESVSNGTVKVAVNIVNVLDGHTVDCVASAY